MCFINIWGQTKVTYFNADLKLQVLYFLHCKFIFHLEYYNPSVQLASPAIKYKNHVQLGEEKKSIFTIWLAHFNCDLHSGS